MNTPLFTWLDIPCADLARAQVFYQGLLRQVGRVEVRGGVVVLGRPGQTVEARLVHRPEGGGAGPIPYLDLGEGLAAALAQVERLGGRILEPLRPIPPYGRRALIEDCEGNRLALYGAD